MIWVLFFFLALSVLLSTLVLAFIKLAKKQKKHIKISAFNLLFIGVFLSSSLLYTPVYASEFSFDFGGILKMIILSLHNAIRLFTVDDGYDKVLESITTAPEWIQGAYSVISVAMFLVAPLMTFSFLLSFFRNLSAGIHFITSWFNELYVFSELNEKAVVLAEDILKNHPKARVVFTDILEKNDECFYDLSERVKKMGAICFKNDITSVKFRFHSEQSQISFFLISETEQENFNHYTKLVSEYNDRRNTRVYIFSVGTISELLVSSRKKGEMKVHRIDEVRSLVMRVLYEQGYRLFDSSVENDAGEKIISAAIIGMGAHGTEMTKALSWYCQMDGYKFTIDAFDKDELTEERFSAHCPELMNKRKRDASVCDDVGYSIEIHSGLSVHTKRFEDEIVKIKNVSYVFVALGDDELNIRTAINLRMLFERIGAKPVIQVVVNNSDAKIYLADATNYKKQKYNIDVIGDIKTSYSERVIINSELENEALQRHLKWGDEDEFWRYEYNYRSSVASAIHMRARIHCGIPGADKREEELTERERSTIEHLEHRRWNAYMRAEGYIYSGSNNPESRNDLAKMHHDLVEFSSLCDVDKRKNSKVGTR